MWNGISGEPVPLTDQPYDFVRKDISRMWPDTWLNCIHSQSDSVAEEAEGARGDQGAREGMKNDK